MIKLSPNLSLFNETEFIAGLKKQKIMVLMLLNLFPYDFDAQLIKEEIDKNNLFLCIFNSPQ